MNHALVRYTDTGKVRNSVRMKSDNKRKKDKYIEENTWIIPAYGS